MFYFDDFYGKKILKSTLLKETDCFFTTREFVLTPSNMENLQNEAHENRELLKEKLGVSEIITAKQVHGDNVEIIDEKNFFYDATDALISNIPSTVMLLNYADCVPVILYSKKDNTGAVIHAGWRGTSKQIVSKTVDKLTKEMGISPENITALIGPSIGKCCFETEEDVFIRLIQDTRKNELYEKSGKKYKIDLKLLNKYQLMEKDIHNIDICDYCTCCMSDIFFSYRKEKGKTARHSAVLKIRGNK